MFFWRTSVFLACAITLVGTMDAVEARERKSFDAGWKFQKGDIPSAREYDFDDSKWRTLDLPHDWSIEAGFHPGALAGWRGGYVHLGTGWYRKAFKVPAATQGKKVYVTFDGIYKDSEVWINGKCLGSRWYGYASLRYDLTPHLNFGGENLLAVRVDNPTQTCRWYTGSGIYRHTWLEVADRLAVAHWGTHVTTPEVAAKSAVVHLATRVVNEYEMSKPCTLATVLLDPHGNTVAEGTLDAEVAAGGSHVFQQELTVKRPALWSAERPAMYSAKTFVRSGGATIDAYTTPFGIRKIAWDAERGFVINGRSVVLKGANIHHDLGALGAAFDERAAERRLEVLKAVGCNAIRMAHNPPAPQLLDLCDRMGFYVIDEAFDKWSAKRYQTLDDDWPKDLRAMIQRDRNHPSVILWSLGNENWAPSFSRRKDLYQKMVAEAEKYDNSRKFTYALSPGDFTADARMMDVVSLNYMEDMLDKYRRAAPKKVMIISESYPYRGQGENEHVHPWFTAAEHPDVAGSFVWTGIAYLGEAKAQWPLHGWNCSLIDTCGFRQPISYANESFWSEKPMVHAVVMSDALETQRPVVEQWGWPKMVSHWTLPNLEGRGVKIGVFTNCDEVELQVNKTSQGRKRRSDFGNRMVSWEEVPYAAGTLQVVGFNDGKAVCVQQLNTAGPAERIELTADRNVVAANRRGLVHATVRIVDAKGTRVPSASHRVNIAVSGAGRLRALDNGDLTCPEPYTSASRPAFHGRCLAIVQSSGKPGPIAITASADGLEPATIIIGGR